MVTGILRALRKHEEQVEVLDIETIRRRIGDPLPPPSKPAAIAYVRKDGRPVEQRSWRKVAGLTR